MRRRLLSDADDGACYYCSGKPACKNNTNAQQPPWYGKRAQTNKYEDNQVAVHLKGSPDFVALAKAYGIPAERVSSKEAG